MVVKRWDSHIECTPKYNLNLDMLEFAKQITLEAGEIVKKYYYAEELHIENKSEKDLVTEADKACEEFLIQKIKAEYPSHHILGEEGLAEVTADDVLNMMKKDAQEMEPVEMNAEPIDTTIVPEELPLESYKWIIDPIDGTTNFAHGVPLFGISIGIEKTNTDGSTEMIIGIIYNPVTGEFFYAEKGKGAYLEMIGANGITMEPKKLQVSSQTELSKSLLATGFHPGFPELMERNFEYFKKLQLASHTVRRFGAASIDLAYTAAGYFEGYWELKLKPWDLAAGVLLVEEAGGKITALDGSPCSIYDAEILATNGSIHEEMIEHLT